jgi:hypothetical protein
MADEDLEQNDFRPDSPTGSGTVAPNDPARQAAIDNGLQSFLPDSAPAARSSSFEEASAKRQVDAGGAATFAEESAARQERAGGAATFAQESDARHDRAVSSRVPGQTGPDSRDRDRTGRISKDEGRAIERAAGGTSKSSFDAGKIQAVLSRIGRSIGGQKEIDRQLDSAFGTGNVQQRPEPVAVDGPSSQPEAFDATGALDNSVDPGIASNPRSIPGLSGFSI